MSDERHQNLLRCQQQLGYRFQDVRLLERALTHKSMSGRPTNPLTHNEVLEFLGDAVLELAVTDYLVRKYGHQMLEGDLTKRRTYIINTTTLSRIGRRLHLLDFIRFRPDKTAVHRFIRQLLADTLEAIIGAIYLDSDFVTARDWILRVFAPELKMMEHNLFHWINYRNILQEYLQSFAPELPEYHVVRSSGPEHAREFEIAVVYRGTELGRGVGPTKKQAAQRAARSALQMLQDPDLRARLGLTTPPPAVESVADEDTVWNSGQPDEYPTPVS